MLKLFCALAIGDAPIHDVVTREKRLLGSEHAFVHFYLIPDRVPKYSTKQSLPLYNQGSSLAVFRYPEHPRFPDGIPDSPEQ